MTGSPKYLLIQERLGNPLDDLLLSWRAARVSAPAMARMLMQATRVSVSPQAVRTWLRELEGAANGDTAAA